MVYDVWQKLSKKGWFVCNSGVNGRSGFLLVVVVHCGIYWLVYMRLLLWIRSGRNFPRLSSTSLPSSPTGLPYNSVPFPPNWWFVLKSEEKNKKSSVPDSPDENIEHDEKMELRSSLNSFAVLSFSDSLYFVRFIVYTFIRPCSFFVMMYRL